MPYCGNMLKFTDYDIVFREIPDEVKILGDKADKAELTMLLDNGADLHSYQPNAEDIAKIAECDLFIYVGGESDEWVEDALKEATNKNMKVINLLEVLGSKVKEEDVKEGMEAEEHDHHDSDAEAEEHDSYHGDAEAEEHNDSDTGHEHHGDEPEYDEHVWLSLKNTMIICDAIAEALKETDADNSDVYETNVKAYKEKLEALDKEYQDTVDKAKIKTLLFGDRFPFRYFVDDYNLDYFAAFVGCSAETEASFETVKFLANKVDELGLKAIMTIEGPNHKIAETIIQNTKTKDQEILTMDSMQSTSAEDVKNGTTYLSVMTKNLDVLKKALQ